MKGQVTQGDAGQSSFSCSNVCKQDGGQRPGIRLIGLVSVLADVDQIRSCRVKTRLPIQSAKFGCERMHWSELPSKWSRLGKTIQR